jgi:hypothetical protein
MQYARRSASRWLYSASLLVFACVLASADADEGEDRPSATPYRPTVSTPAQLSEPHWLEGEFGGLYFRERSSDADLPHRFSVPYTLKYAFTEDWGIRLGGEALVRASGDGGHEIGFGDTSIVLKRRFAFDDSSAFGLEVGVLMPSAKRDLQIGSGKPDWSVNGIYSVDLGAWHTDVNLIGTRIGAKDSDQSRWQSQAALAVSHPLVGSWSAAGEWSGTHQQGQNGTAQFLGALTYALRKDAILDFGAARGLNRATPSWQAFAGITVVIGRID